jgi:hypothetical protein
LFGLCRSAHFFILKLQRSRNGFCFRFQVDRISRNSHSYNDQFPGHICHYFYLERRFGDWILSPPSSRKPSMWGPIDRTSRCLRTPQITEGIIQYISPTQHKSPARVKGGKFIRIQEPCAYDLVSRTLARILCTSISANSHDYG